MKRASFIIKCEVCGKPQKAKRATRIYCGSDLCKAIGAAKKQEAKLLKNKAMKEA